MGCPCKEGRYGAFGLVVSIYWAMQCGGFAAMGNLVAAGASMGIWWAVWTGFAVVLLVEGIRQALSHDDAADYQSVFVSVALIGVALWALAHNWFWVGAEWTTHVSRVFWPGLLGSEAFNLWLNFRGRFRRRVAAMPAPVEQQPFRLRRSRSIEWVEEIEQSGWQEGHDQGWHDALIEFDRQHHAVGRDGVPLQILYVRDEHGNFIPLPPEQVPVNRRLR
jgi:hypothetical protein